MKNADDILEPLPADVAINEYLLIRNLSRDELSIIDHNPKIMQKLVDDDEKTLALYLNKVIQNDPLKVGVRENLTDAFVNFILTDMRFNRFPFLLNIQPDYSFEVFGTKVTAKPEFSVEKNKVVLCFDEDKHLHGIGSSTEYGESQMAAEMLACAFTNFDRPDSPFRGQDQVLFAIRVIGARFTFYRCSVTKEYCESLRDGFPTDSMSIFRYPPRDIFLGFDYADPDHRPQILSLLLRLREHMKGM